MTLEEAKQIIEALIFAAPRPVSCSELGEILEIDKQTVERLVEQLAETYSERGIIIRRAAGGYQFVTAPKLGGWVEKLGRPVINSPLSLAGLETLAIVAYQQPITKSEIEQIRGVRSDSAINTLLERELIEEVGRKDGPGRPILYGTSEKFLLHFNLDGLHQLPERQHLEAAAAQDE